MNLTKKPLPSWLYLPLVVVYNELLLHLWVTEGLHLGRLAAVLTFGLGFGGLLGLLTSFIPSAKWRKRTAMGLALFVGAFWITEFFVCDAYQVFMTPKLMLEGAGGVATDYFELVVSLLTRDLWRILLVLLPVAAYGLFFRCPGATRRNKELAASVTAAALLLAFGIVNFFTADAIRLSTAYEFDSAVRCFGLNLAITLETFRGSAETEEPAFVAAPTMPPTTEAPDSAEETAPTEVPPVEYGWNVNEKLDFAALAEAETNKTVASVHSYVNSVPPSRQNEYTGLFQGKNLILITAEAFTAEVIDPERTPTLHRMATKGIEFTEYYQPAWGASTTAGEFSNLTGIVPLTGGMCMDEMIQQDMFLTMGHQMQALGYASAAYHNHLHDFYDRNKTHVHIGYDKFIAQYGGLEGVDPVWPESDLQLIDATVGDYIDSQPFSIYYMTVSGHSMYSKNENFQAKKHYDIVADLDFPEPVKCYLAAQMELEYAMEALIGYLEEAGIADDTVIVIATDHYPYGLANSSTWKNSRNYLRDLFGTTEYDIFIRDHSDLIIWSGCLEGMDLKIDTPVYSLDIVPTLSNLFGTDYDSRLLVGRDVFSDTQPLVLWPDYSWKTELGTYASRTGKFTPNEGAEVPEGYVEYISSLVSNKITFSRSVQNLNYYNYLSPIWYGE